MLWKEPCGSQWQSSMFYLLPAVLKDSLITVLMMLQVHFVLHAGLSDMRGISSTVMTKADLDCLIGNLLTAHVCVLDMVVRR